MVTAFKLLSTIIFLLFCNIRLHADEFVVISFKHRPEVTAAREKVMVDVNDRKCALIIVKTDVDLSNAMFDANPMVCGSRKEAPGEWWVYVAPGSTKLQIKKEGFIPLDFFIPTGISLESLNTYELHITNKDRNLPPDKEKQPEFIKIRSVPEGAKVYLDNQYKGQTPFDSPELEGTYLWKIELDRYYTEEGEITVVTGNTPVINKTLKPRFGDIKISSLPESGADILLDGVRLNKKTPSTIKEVNSGSHIIELLLDMYEPATQQVTVTDGQTADLRAEMKPLFGEVSINTKPAADIYIDKIKAGNGRISNKRLVSGTHFLEAKKDNYTDATKTITVQTGSKETYTLEPQPRTGTLSVTSTPTDASLYLDGVLKGQTPMFVRNLLIGDYTVQIKKDGYGALTKKVSIKENQTTELKDTLPQGQLITITTLPEGARIRINGDEEQNTPYTGILSYGTYKIVALPPSDSFVETPADITVSEGGSTKFIIAINANNQFTDSRDGKTYKTVKISTQTWMAENLNYSTSSGSWCYENKSTNCDKYGRLYDWETAIKICPAGWHLPSNAEWDTLSRFVGNDIGNKLKSASGWSGNGNGTDVYGFKALPGGFRTKKDETYASIGYYGNWWSSTKNSSEVIWGRDVSYDDSNINMTVLNMADGFSVRCIKTSVPAKAITEVSKPNESKQPAITITDSRDNKTYKTVKIGTQTWMAENLNYTGNNGFQRQITDSTQWRNNTKRDGWCYYDNNSSNGSIYGVLYQWEAAKKACPGGWHLPSDDEWKTLEIFTGMSKSDADKTRWRGTEEGKKFKTTTGWSSNGNGTDAYGFSALPGGYRSYDGKLFDNIRDYGYWWSSIEFSTGKVYGRLMYNLHSDVYRGIYNKNYGFSVRCVKD